MAEKHITGQGYIWKYKQNNQKTLRGGSVASWEYLQLWPGERQSKNGVQRMPEDSGQGIQIIGKTESNLNGGWAKTVVSKVSPHCRFV